jgi:hypothetical protein
MALLEDDAATGHEVLVTKVLSDARSILRKLPMVPWQRDIAEVAARAILELADQIFKGKDAKDPDVAELSRLIKEDVDQLDDALRRSTFTFSAEDVLQKVRVAVVDISEVVAPVPDEDATIACAWSGRPILPNKPCFAVNIKGGGKHYTRYVAVHPEYKTLYIDQLRLYIKYTRFVNAMIRYLLDWQRDYSPKKDVPYAEKMAAFCGDDNERWIAVHVSEFIKIRHFVTTCIVNPEIVKG